MKKVMEILQELHPNFDFAVSKDFFADGYLDSFDLTKLIVQIEDTYDIEIKGEDVAAENFQNAGAICGLLKRYGIQDDD